MGTCERRFRRAFFIKSSIFFNEIVAFISIIVFRESFIDPILVIERHFDFKKK